MEIFKIGINDGQYDGSRRFAWLAELFGLSVDLVSRPTLCYMSIISIVG